MAGNKNSGRRKDVGVFVGALKATCKRGHPWTEESTAYWARKNGGNPMRICRTCYKARRKGAVLPDKIMSTTEDAKRNREKKRQQGFLEFERERVARAILDDLGRVYQPRDDEEPANWQGWETV